MFQGTCSQVPKTWCGVSLFVFLFSFFFQFDFQEWSPGQYRFDIYRLGWYNGLGARQVATLKPVVQLPQEQPECHKELVLCMVSEC